MPPMKTLLSYALLLALSQTFLAEAFSSKMNKEVTSNTPMKEYLIRLETELDDNDREKVFGELGLKNKERVTKMSPLYLVLVPESKNFEELKKAVEAHPKTRYIEPNMQYAVPLPVEPKKPTK